MQPVARRLLIVAAIAVGGGVTGVVLGNFVASGSKKTGLEELAAYKSLYSEQNAAALDVDEPSSALSARPGPGSYDCKGCDASLYNGLAVGNAYEPEPPYVPEDQPRPATKRKPMAPPVEDQPDLPQEPPTPERD